MTLSQANDRFPVHEKSQGFNNLLNALVPKPELGADGANSGDMRTWQSAGCDTGQGTVGLGDPEALLQPG